MKVETKEKKTTTVTVTKDKITGDVIVNDIQPCVQHPPALPIVDFTQSDTYGNVETVVTNKKVIKESKEIKVVVENIYKEEPQLAILPVVSIKTVKYGDI